MLKGINVLNTYEIVNSEWQDIIVPAVSFAGLAFIGFMLVAWILSDRKRRRENVAVLCVIIFITLLLLVGCIWGFTHLPEHKYQTRYDVTIDYSVNFNEFTSKYEVVKQEGLIYTIVEKTNEG